MLVSLVKALLLFTVVGPLIGLGCILFLEPSAIRAPLLLLVMPYAIGAGPALVTGFAAWMLRDRLARYSGGLFCACIGAVASAVFGLAFPQNTGVSPWELLALLGAIGGLAGLICGLAYFWPPNNSSKPKPLRGSA